MEFKRDAFKVDRGGYSRLYKICCEQCGEQICLYQKDGPGGLRRMYVDRMFATTVSAKSKNLHCPNKHLLGIKINYEKENRPAFRLFVEAITKQVVSSKKF